MYTDLDDMKLINNRKKNLRALENRLARNAALWIEDKMSDEDFFRKIENMEIIMSSPVFQYSELYKYYDKNGEVNSNCAGTIVSLNPIAKRLRLE